MAAGAQQVPTALRGHFRENFVAKSYKPVRASESVNFLDRVLKVFNESLRIVATVFELPSVGMVKEAGQVRNCMYWVGTSRGFFAFGHFFGTVIFDLLDAVYRAIYLGKWLLMGARPQERKVLTVSELKANEDLAAAGRPITTARMKFPTVAARAAGFFGEIFKVAEKVSFATCFMVCNPLRMFNSFFPDVLSRGAVAVGNQFSIWWTSFHLCAFLSNLCEAVRLHIIAFGGHINMAAAGGAEALKKVWEEIGRVADKLLEGMLDLPVDFNNLFQLGIPALITCSFSMASALLGIARCYRELK